MAIQSHRKLLLSYWDQFIYHSAKERGREVRGPEGGTGGEGERRGGEGSKQE